MGVRILDSMILGSEINATIARAIAIARDTGERVGFRFNGVDIEVLGPSDPVLIYRDWDRAMKGYIKGTVGPAPAPRLSKAEMASDRKVEAENQQRRDAADADYRQREAEGKAVLAAELADAPPMERNEPLWAEAVAAQKGEAYGLACFEYAETWARLMQKRMADGARLPDVAQDASVMADKGFGITGFMYGCAVAALSQCWVHGDDLRRWHNGEYVADESVKGVVNPAVPSASPLPAAQGGR